jgi:hypothetical protein
VGEKYTAWMDLDGARYCGLCSKVVASPVSWIHYARKAHLAEQLLVLWRTRLDTEEGRDCNFTMTPLEEDSYYIRAMNSRREGSAYIMELRDRGILRDGIRSLRL